MRMKKTKQRSMKYGRRRSSRTLMLGLLAGSVLAGVGSYEAFAEELNQPTKDADKTFTIQGKEDAQVKADADKVIRDIQKGKADTYSLLTKKGGTYALSEDFSKRVEGSIGYEEVEDGDTDTVKRLKDEQKNLSAVIKTKYEEAKSLGGVLQGVRGESLGSGTLTKQVTVNEGEERLTVLTGELEALVAVKGILDTDLGDAKNIEDEIAKIEEAIRLQLQDLLGENIEGSFGLAEDGTLNVSGDYIEYLNVLESNQGSLNVRSSFVQQTTKDSQVLASYYGQNSDLDNVIAEGFKYLAMPYVWGGESVSEGGFDCSGLMYRIFKDELGIELPRVAQDQQNFGKQIPLDEIQPGDLVFWNTPATHVALYLGDGKIMEAANPQAGLRVRDVRLSELSSATRVHDFGVADKGSVVHITNAKRTVSYTPVLNREQSVEYNNTVEKATPKGLTQAEINKKVKEIEQKAKEEQERANKQKAEKAKQEQATKQKAEQDKLKAEKAKQEQEKAEKAKLEKAKSDKAKQEQADKEKAEKEKAEKDKAEKEPVTEVPKEEPKEEVKPEPTPKPEPVPEVTEPDKGVDEGKVPEEQPKESTPVQDSVIPEKPEPAVVEEVQPVKEVPVNVDEGEVEDVETPSEAEAGSTEVKVE